jgi:hypothetical protein
MKNEQFLELIHGILVWRKSNYGFHIGYRLLKLISIYLGHLWNSAPSEQSEMVPFWIIF